MRLVLLTLLLTTSASAQLAGSNEVGRIVGTVTDAETGDPLIGANIYLPGLQRGAATDVEGQDRILGLPEGTHTVQISYTGYHTVRDSVQIGNGTTPLPATLTSILLNDVIVCCWHGPPLIPRSAYAARRALYPRASEPAWVYTAGR